MVRALAANFVLVDQIDWAKPRNWCVKLNVDVWFDIDSLEDTIRAIQTTMGNLLLQQMRKWTYVMMLLRLKP